MSGELYGKPVTNATLMTLDEAKRSAVTGWLEIWPAGEKEAHIQLAVVCFGKITGQNGLLIYLARLPFLYNHRPGLRMWVGPPPTDAERAAAPWED